MKILKPILLALALLAGSAAASDQLLNSLRPRGAVNDFANVIPAAQEQQLTALLTGLERQTGDAVVIVTLPSLDGGQIDDFANRLYEKWGIGQTGQDNGLLLLTSIQDRKARIEVGYGLEGVINDALAGRILRENIFPQFKQQRYGAGIEAGTSRILSLIASERGIQISGVPQYSRTDRHSARSNRKTNPVVAIIFIIGFIYMAIRHPRLLLFILLTSGRGGSRGGGGFGGGGFGGFGGGSSGGGGASGGW